MESDWRVDIDALSFQPAGHRGNCVVHRRAFRSLLGFEPAPNDCRFYFIAQQAAFLAAAATKIARAGITSDSHFHLNSRDIRHALRGIDPA